MSDNRGMIYSFILLHDCHYIYESLIITARLDLQIALDPRNVCNNLKIHTTSLLFYSIITLSDRFGGSTWVHEIECNGQ